MSTIRIAVLVSGGGTNLQAIIDAQKAGILTSGKVELVVADKKEAYALTRAENNNIKTEVIVKKECASKQEFEEKIIAVLEENKIDFIILAGFMQILSESFTTKYANRIINVHPSLIPSFCGKGYYGLKVHEGALKRGVKITGATVHFVDEGTDTGPIILQKAVEVKEGDTPEILQKRVMEEAEWVILPKAIDMIAKGEI